MIILLKAPSKLVSWRISGWDEPDIITWDWSRSTAWLTSEFFPYFSMLKKIPSFTAWLKACL